MDPCVFFKCLSDDVRLKLLLLISEAGEACVCDLMEAVKVDQPKTSRNLAKLRQCEILQDQRRGKWMYYRLHPALPDWAKTVIQETAQKNHSYLGDALKKLQLSQEKTANCC